MTGIRWAAVLLAVTLCMAVAGCGGAGGGNPGGGDAGSARGEPEEPRDADALEDRYAALTSEVNAGVRDVTDRLADIAGDEGDGPGAQLDEVLGPEDPDATEGDLFDDACTLSGVSCEASELEGLLENDREDFADEDEYHPDACDVTTDRAYYEGYDLASTDDGARYVRLREELRGASDGLGDEAERLAEKAREVEASGFEAGSLSSWSVSEVEALAERARAAESEAEDALAVAEERYSGYEERVEEVRAEALALHDREGC